MDLVVTHLKEFYLYYLIGAVILLPAIFFTRKYSLPIIFYTLETAIYLILMHCAFYIGVKVTRWFAENSSMKALQEDGKPIDAPEWGTPFLQFWDKEAYTPAWMIYVEIVAAIIIIILVWKFRPLRIKYKPKKRQFANEGKSQYRPDYRELRNAPPKGGKE
ncbi:MAG TPA: hypothetical protein PLI09_26655 [Candidatus Hydrogenedentes bacterium]|nr:hypothetical protein [Candidatus Hydrogenedentota bacterium]